MKAIILAAGKWTRLLPLTLDIPKAMVQVHGKSLLEHNMDRLVSYVDEFIIVVKYKQEIIQKYFWEEFQWIQITYHEQWDKSGTGWALEWIDISWDCFIIASDTIYRQSDIDLLANTPWYSALCQEVVNPEKYWIFEVDEESIISKVIEKPQEFISNLASLFYLKVNSKLIDYCIDLEVSPRWEYELTDAINIFVQHHSLNAIRIQNNFIDITSIKDLEKANRLIKPKLWDTQYLENIWNYELHLGIPKAGVQEIVDYSLDETDIPLREWTSDWKKRFISTDNLTAWYNDVDRYPFTLLSKDWVVAGLWWGRPAQSPHISEILNQDLFNLLQKYPDDIHTSWIRVYPFARWERLASPFMKSCERYYKSLFQSVYMSDDVGYENIPSQKAFERLWYGKVGYWKNINNSPDSGKKRYVYLKKY